MQTPLPAAVPLRERKKDATRRALMQAANRRFHRQGFEATTVDEICADADVGRRTLFRYFPDKESLAFPHRAERLEAFSALLQAAPADESPFASLRRIAHVLAREYAANRERMVAQNRLVRASPALVAREHEIDRDWETAMAHTFRRRFEGSPEADLQAQMLAGAAIGLIRATLRYWFEHEGRPDLGRLGEQALDSLQAGFSSPATDHRPVRGKK